MLHVQAGKALLAFYQDSFYRGFCLRVLASEAEVWFADYGNIAHVKKTDLRTLPKVSVARQLQLVYDSRRSSFRLIEPERFGG